MKDKEAAPNFNQAKTDEGDSGTAETEPAAPRNDDDDDDDSSGAEDVGDDDATSAKLRKRHDQEQGYDDPEEDEMLPDSGKYIYIFQKLQNCF